MWGKAKSQSNVTFSSCLPWSFLLSPLVIQQSEYPHNFSWLPLIQPVTYVLHVDTPPFSIPPTLFMQHFYEGPTYVLFTLGNTCTSCYATHETYTAFSPGYLFPIYFRQLVHFLLFHRRKRSLSQYPTNILFSICLSSNATL